MADRVPPALDAAWQALIDDLHAELDQGHMHVQRLIDRHALSIESAARLVAPAPRPSEDREAEVAALAEAIRKYADLLCMSGGETREAVIRTIVRAAHPDLASKVAAAIPGSDIGLREALERIRDTTLDQPAAVNVPDEDWYRRLLLDAMGTARAALRGAAAIPGPAPDVEPRPTSVLVDGELEVQAGRYGTRAELHQLSDDLDLVDQASPAEDHEVVAEWTRS